VKINAVFRLGEKHRRRTADQIQDFATVVGAESALFGRFTGKDNYMVHGRVEGECDLDGAIMIGQTGCWVGNIVAAHVFVAGEVAGNITAHAKLEIMATARICGNLDSPVIAIATGAAYDGKIHMEKQPLLTTYSERREP